MKFTQEILEQIGLEPERLKMVNVSAAMGVQFAQNAKDFSDKIVDIGPNPIKSVSEETAS